MAYTKTTWNNLSDPPINADNLNKIEQGIYDNSLGIDKINPSGTATTTAEIEEGQINDVIGFKSLKLKGQTSQYTTTGKNIFPRITFSQTINGVTITATGDGTIKIKGTANSSGVNHPIWGAWGSSTTLFTIPAGTYTASGIGTRQSSPRMNIVTNGTTSIFVTNTTQTLDSDTNVTGIFIWVDAGTTVDTTFKPMIETGSSATSYEPYTGKKASPNPDFPQEVNNVSGYNVVGISNKNILPNPIQSQTLNGITITRNSDGTLLINGTATANTYFDFSTDFDTTKYAGYKFYGFPDNPGFFIRISKSNRVALQDISSNGTVISNNGTGNYIAIRIAGGSNVNNRLLSPMIIAPTISDTSYAPHRENNFEVNLGKNLFNKDDSSLIFNGFANRSSLKLESNASAKTICQPCKPNTTYTISKILSAKFFVDETSSSTISNGISITPLSTGSSSNVTSYTVTTSASAKYLLIYYYVSSADTLSEETIRNSIQIEVGSQVTSYANYFPPIEICKIGTYQDYIYKKDGKWFKHKAVQKIKLDGSETYVLDAELTTVNRFRLNITSYKINSVASTNSGLCNQLKIANAYSQDDEHTYSYGDATYMALYLFYNRTRCADLTALVTWLSANNVIVYGGLITPIEEEITYTPLIRQLDELYNSGLYDVTNISQDNSNEAFVLDLEACKNNINGIVEYIRR